MTTDMHELVGAKTKPPFSNFQQFSLDYIIFSCVLSAWVYNTEWSSIYFRIQSLSIPVKIIIVLYKCPLDAYGLKSCEQNNSLVQSLQVAS